MGDKSANDRHCILINNYFKAIEKSVLCELCFDPGSAGITIPEHGKVIKITSRGWESRGLCINKADNAGDGKAFDFQ